MTSIELKRLKVELARVSASRLELELKIEERLDEVERLKTHVVVQEKREDELRTMIADAQPNVKLA